MGSEDFLPDDINFSGLSLDIEEKQFHSVIGHIEDILMDDQFLEMHTNFMEKYWQQFEDSEENKFIYTDIFKEYVETIEKYLEDQLIQRMPTFSMTRFENELRIRHNDLDGEVFEMLETFSDFCAFKTMFLDYKNMKEGKMVDFSSDFNVSKYIVQETAM